MRRREFVLGGVASAALCGVRGVWASEDNSVAMFHDRLAVAMAREGVPILSRDLWAPSPPVLSRLRRTGGYQRITVHHSGATRNYDTIANAVIYDIDNIYAGHTQRRYGDIGYHFILDYAGRIWEGRSLKYQGAHVAGENEGNIGVMLLGNFEEQSPSVGQLAALSKLNDTLCRLFEIRKEKIYGHRDLGPSACPGRNLYRHLERLRGQA